MAKTLSAAWILPAVQKALGVGEAGADAGVGGATAASAAAAAASEVTLPTREPKIVQVTQGSGEGGYLVVNDSQTTIAVLLTPQARKQFERSPLVRPLAGLRNCLVKLDRWVVSYLPLAADSAGPRLAHDLDRNLAPICLQASAFSFVSGDQSLTFGSPVGVNANDGVQQRYWTALKRVPDLVQQLARAQGLPRLPDSRGQDALPEAVDDEHPFAWAEAQEMFRQEAEALAAAGGGAVSAIVAGMRNDLPLVDLMRQLEQRRRQEQQAGALQAQRLPPPPQQQAQRSSARCSSPQQSPERKQPPQQQPGLEGMDDESFLEAGGGMASQFPMSPGQEEVETQPPGQEEVEEEAPPEVLPPTVRPPAQPAAPSSPARTTRAAAASAVAAATAPMHTDAQAKSPAQRQGKGGGPAVAEQGRGEKDGDKEQPRRVVMPAGGRGGRGQGAASTLRGKRGNLGMQSQLYETQQLETQEEEKQQQGGAAVMQQEQEQEQPPHPPPGSAPRAESASAASAAAAPSVVNGAEEGQPTGSRRRLLPGSPSRRAQSPPKKRQALPSSSSSAASSPARASGRGPPAAAAAAVPSSRAAAAAPSPPPRREQRQQEQQEQQQEQASSAARPLFGGKRTIWAMMGLLKKPKK